MDSILLTGSSFDPQETSSLFSKLPSEIRVYIFELALTADTDGSKPYRHDRAFHRPGYRFHTKINCALLYTCKKAYYEARLLPLSVNEHVFWLFNGPWKSVGKTTRHTAQWAGFYSRLGNDQRDAVGKVHIFAQQYYLEGLGNRDDLQSLKFPAKSLCLTLRHSDWWSWESPPASSDRLGICPWRPERTSSHQMLAEPAEPTLEYIQERMSSNTWGGQVCTIIGLKTLEMEFEIEDRKKRQLDVVVERAKSWKFPLHQGRTLEWTGRLEESSWTGLKSLKDDNQMLRESPIPENAPTRCYHVVKMSWNAVGAPATNN